MNNFSVDLSNCDKEPIHIPGKVQSHGFLIAVDKISFFITYVSENIGAFLNASSTDFLEKPLSSIHSFLTQQEPEVSIEDLLKLGIIRKSFDAINPHPVNIDKNPFYIIISESENNWLIEFEPATLQYDIQGLIGRSASIMLQGKSVSALLKGAASEVKKLIHYDRVMVYKFLDDGHGEVIAEDKNDDLEPFFGLHYPASDIPKQARELYKLNLTRLIADVNQDDSPIVTFLADQPLDLTKSGLRAVSPIHIQYLKNMGVHSSFSISLISHGELWGLIACHNYSPKIIDYKAREGAKLIGQILSSALEYREDEEDAQMVEQFKSTAAILSEHLSRDKYLLDAITSHERNILEVTNATGVAVLFEKNIKTIGIVPSDEDILELAEWLKATSDESIYYTHRLSELHLPAKKYKSIASGILACYISKELGELIIWFKPELIANINWAGNPDKPVVSSENGLLSLSPRKSFESWSEVVSNTSEKWLTEEIASVLRIREIIINDVNKKANEIRLLNEKLQSAYEELDTFSYTISHDLRTPLTSIKTYAELMLKNKTLDDTAIKMLSRILIGADKMNFLIKEILNLAKVGRSEISFEHINMQTLLNEIASEVWIAFKADKAELILGQLPDLKGDKTMIAQVFTNLISNAVKYSLMIEKPIIEISGYIEGGEIIYAVKDNGIGIDNRYYDRVFELFKRMDNVKEIEGTGVGLAIVKRVVQRHQGRVWFESKLNAGSTFYVAFKNIK
ncbi:light-regulated signal transduction histidine kinase (bacteriophytochrome) [Pedobacter psychrotolerans]|uniref:histidine kinase n=1 Tax=Pedobacter psychrotolerans TaxID=1843235 RepID=A0A4R2H8Q5_9SPHI|nr:ATP-binding protein [Pedobacter psychrotolerans]TCO22648.1 light-regulated signal transduction histidine kinase (bacteriophytochrome) [Pedobacter psychrotolerans]GGE66103.1 histidine kinase [Pedobacter psychrotolerans]